MGFEESNTGEAGRAVLIAIFIASVLTPLGTTMITVALPDIQDQFSVNIGLITVFANSFLVTIATLQPVGGRLGDAFGHLRVTTIGLLILIGASLAGGAAPYFWMLIIARAAQGAAAGLIIPNGIAYLRNHMPAGRLGFALGITGSAFSIGAAMGPIVGGTLIHFGDWRWLFLVNAPLAILALVLIRRLPRDRHSGTRKLSLDFISLGLLLLATTIFVGLGWAVAAPHVRTLIVGIVGLLATLALYGWLFRRRQRGIVDLRLFTNVNYTAACAAVFLGNAVQFGVLISMPLYLGKVRGASGGLIGLYLFLVFAAMIVIAPLAGRLADALGNKRLMIAGASVHVLAAALVATLVGRSDLALAIPLPLMGVALGLGQAAQQSTALQAWPATVSGAAFGTYSMMRGLGSIAGTCIVASVVRDITSGEVRMLFLILTVCALLGLTAVSFMRTGSPARVAVAT